MVLTLRFRTQIILGVVITSIVGAGDSVYGSCGDVSPRTSSVRAAINNPGPYMDPLIQSGLIRESSQGQCVAKASPDLARPNFASFVKSHKETDEFIKYVLPFAVELQDLSGFPASVTLAQAIFESGSGTSHVASQYGVFFGVTCDKHSTDWASQSTSIEAAPKIRYQCDVPRSKSEHGFYRRYENDRSAFLAYLNTVAFSPHTAKRYQPIRQELSKLNAHEVADWPKIILGLSRYSMTGTYVKHIKKTIEDYHLSEFDKLKICPT